MHRMIIQIISSRMNSILQMWTEKNGMFSNSCVKVQRSSIRPHAGIIVLSQPAISSFEKTRLFE